ncbi:hypothetical protein [Amycolatopsis dendrobii]|uniref:Uncharacterized protein n=1 Tax=Amycolatopsis dendrobii TaxID=2760662 RepID=A0A7W3VVX6_9PSEU|nr:hypothetical protein [Amycolatopsis dendrobii]MBB1153994.1 hypothetical protein [Amycolatopsis dendrobii]
MALPDLATVANLNNRGIDTTNTARVTEFLGSASDAVRDAAGVPITAGTFTVTIVGEPDQWLSLPGQPVTAVSNVLLDDVPVTDWDLRAGRLWRARGWRTCGGASNVTLTITGGLVDVPRDIVDLVCSMVGFALHRAEEGYASRGDQTAERIDDYSVQFDASAAGRLAGPMELPDATRRRLRARFGGGASVVKTR